MDPRSIGKIFRLLHATFTKCDFTHDLGSSVILQGPSQDLRCRRTPFVDKHHHRSLEESAISIHFVVQLRSISVSLSHHCLATRQEFPRNPHRSFQIPTRIISHIQYYSLDIIFFFQNLIHCSSPFLFGAIPKSGELEPSDFFAILLLELDGGTFDDDRFSRQLHIKWFVFSFSSQGQCYFGSAFSPNEFYGLRDCDSVGCFIYFVLGILDSKNQISRLHSGFFCWRSVNWRHDCQDSVLVPQLDPHSRKCSSQIFLGVFILLYRKVRSVWIPQGRYHPRDRSIQHFFAIQSRFIYIVLRQSVPSFPK